MVAVLVVLRVLIFRGERGVVSLIGCEKYSSSRWREKDEMKDEWWKFRRSCDRSQFIFSSKDSSRLESCKEEFRLLKRIRSQTPKNQLKVRLVISLNCIQQRIVYKTCAPNLTSQFSRGRRRNKSTMTRAKSGMRVWSILVPPFLCAGPQNGLTEAGVIATLYFY